MSGYVKTKMAQETFVESPIKIFGQAKVQIVQVFEELQHYAVDSHALLSKPGQAKNVVTELQLALVESLKDRLSGIIEMLERNCMKVVFFGRTSNGKSTVINAMLKSKILPSGIGHTTNCFVQVEGTDQPDAYIVTEDSPDVKQSIQSISHLAHALSKVRLDPNSLVRICWPKNRCRLLKDDVVFVDSPGIDVSPDVDQWIDKFCLDADVFILVVNAESTLMQTEKNFFHRVMSRLSKPNIFVLNNRWDASATEPDTIDQVRQQHLERTVSFLCNELSVMEPLEAEERVFFISAFESLDSSSPGMQTPTRVRLAGWESRLIEFNNFEHKFEECISLSALRTKFEHHANNGQSMISDLQKLWDEILTTSNGNRKSCQQSYEEMLQQLDLMEQQQKAVLLDMEDYVKDAIRDIHHKIYSALTDEVNRLSRILEEFDRPFSQNPPELLIYKKDLCFHVEECLTRNLHVRCYGFIFNILSTTTQHLHDCVSSLLNEAPVTCSVTFDRANSANDFEMVYHVDCVGLLAEFHEDIEFRFSFGLTSLARRFLSRQGADVYRISPSSYSRTNADFSAIDPIVTVLSQCGTIYSGSTVGTLAVVAVVTKSVGWRVIMACTAAYCIMYIYERVSWTVKAKEAAFKHQFVDHATNRLRMVVGLVADNCTAQVERELFSTYDKLQHRVNAAKGEMQDKLETLQDNVSQMNQLVKTATSMRSRADAIASQLNFFVSQYLAVRT